mgnify:CR=1 FL=1
MNSIQYKRHSGFALIAGAVLLFITMLFHPSGGSFKHLVESTSETIITHSIGMFSIPFSLFGFWGLAAYFKDDISLSRAAFIASFLALFAGLIAAAINGLALPLFVNRFSNATQETITALKPIIKYNTSINQAFDFIYIISYCLAIILWSFLILRSGEFPKWLGYSGMLLSISVILFLLSGYVLTNLHGFRLFSLGLIIWTLLLGGILIRRP